ncbi:unnamed protein product, partial [Brenthis ino]
MRVNLQDDKDGFTCSPRHGGETRQLTNFGLLLKLTKQKDTITKFGPTRDSKPGPLDVQPYLLATTELDLPTIEP